MPVVVVESPSKAKTINKYLGDSYTVLASYGHVRDLPPKDGSVDPDTDFLMLWEVDADSKKHVKAIADALKDDPNLILATDPDREGEAISWHLTEALRDRKAIKAGTPVSRVTFNAITKAAVTEAMANPRQVDAPLVEAYLARRALDYLVGFNLSPVLWRKLPGAKSAGRVQSVCLRLIVEREMEIEAFRAQEYWTVEAILKTPRGQTFTARLTSLAGKQARQVRPAERHRRRTRRAGRHGRATLSVLSVEAKPATRNPSAALHDLDPATGGQPQVRHGCQSQTMNAAQRLYESGLITYMRTDGIDMAPEAVTGRPRRDPHQVRGAIPAAEPRIYKNKAKNAQEAHECIRPTDMMVDADAARISDSRPAQAL
jgi:DNA topoisomerase I